MFKAILTATVVLASTSSVFAFEAVSLCDRQGVICTENSSEIDLKNGQSDTVGIQTVLRDGWKSTSEGETTIHRGDSLDTVTIVGPIKKMGRQTMKGVQYYAFQAPDGGIIMVETSMKVIFMK